MALVLGGIAPHPPIMIPEIGRSEAAKVQKSQDAMARLAQEIIASGADTLVIISPHSPLFRDAIAVNLNPDLRGDLGNFGAPQLKFTLKNEIPFAQEISRQAALKDITTVGLDAEVLDHGILVPLYFLDKAGIHLPTVALSMAILPREKLYRFGEAIQQASNELGKKVALVASGDLSHRLFPGAPAGYDPEGERFDRLIVEAVNNADLRALLKIPEVVAEKAGECGFRPILMLFGSFEGWDIRPEVFSYEGPFGVGYMVAIIKPLQFTGESRLFAGQERPEENSFIHLARESLEYYVRTGQFVKPPTPISPEMAEPAGVFVSLKKHGELRGCIGTIAPTTDNIAEEIVRNAVSAGTGDPRFWPVSEDELDDITYSVDVLKAPEPIQSLSELDPKRYGVIVRKGRRSGLLLPNLEGIDSAAEQVAIAMQKAGIEPGEEIALERFEVIRYA